MPNQPTYVRDATATLDPGQQWPSPWTMRPSGVSLPITQWESVQFDCPVGVVMAQRHTGAVRLARRTFWCAARKLFSVPTVACLFSVACTLDPPSLTGILLRIVAAALLLPRTFRNIFSVRNCSASNKMPGAAADQARRQQKATQIA